MGRLLSCKPSSSRISTSRYRAVAASGGPRDGRDMPRYSSTACIGGGGGKAFFATPCLTSAFPPCVFSVGISMSRRNKRLASSLRDFSPRKEASNRRR